MSATFVIAECKLPFYNKWINHRNQKIRFVIVHHLDPESPKFLLLDFDPLFLPPRDKPQLDINRIQARELPTIGNTE